MDYYAFFDWLSVPLGYVLLGMLLMLTIQYVTNRAIPKDAPKAQDANVPNDVVNALASLFGPIVNEQPKGRRRPTYGS